jgi:hypothetical protein
MSRIIELLTNGEMDEAKEYFTLFDVPNTPTEDVDFLYLLMGTQSNILIEEGVTFPITLDQFNVIIEPTEFNIKNGTYSIEGIMEQIESFKYKLKYGKPFIKCQVSYDEGRTLPTLKLQFFLFKDAHGESFIKYESQLYFYTFPHYETTLFTAERVEAMTENGINADFIRHIPNISLCPIHFDEKGSLSPLIEFELNRRLWT